MTEALEPQPDRRPHGTRACYVFGSGRGQDRSQGCRCEPCREANRVYARFDAKRQRLQRTTGRFAMPLVDAAPVREHVAMLAGQGVGARRAAELAGVQRQTVRKILGGQPRVLRETAEKLLAVQASPAAHQLVDAADTWFRVRWILDQPGWTKARLSGELGQGGLALQLGRERVTARNAESVKRLFDQLWAERVAERWAS